MEAKDSNFPRHDHSLESLNVRFIEVLALALMANPASLRLILMDQEIPLDALGLIQLLDTLPLEPFIVRPASDPKRSFSAAYLDLLQSQKPSMQLTMAQNAYNNPANWLPGAGTGPLPGTNPIYAPTLGDIMNAVSSGGTTRFEFDTDLQQLPETPLRDETHDHENQGNTELHHPHYFWGTNEGHEMHALNKVAAKHRIKVDIEIDNLAAMGIQFGGWYMPPIFTLAYSNPSNWNTGTGTVNYDSLFGRWGRLRNVNTNIYAAGGIQATMTTYGHYSAKDLETLRTNPQVHPWPLFAQGPGVTTTFVLNADHSITVTVVLAPTDKNPLLLALGVESLSTLVGGGPA